MISVSEEQASGVRSVPQFEVLVLVQGSSHPCADIRSMSGLVLADKDVNI